MYHTELIKEQAKYPYDMDRIEEIPQKINNINVWKLIYKNEAIVYHVCVKMLP